MPFLRKRKGRNRSNETRSISSPFAFSTFSEAQFNVSCFRPPENPSETLIKVLIAILSEKKVRALDSSRFISNGYQLFDRLGAQCGFLKSENRGVLDGQQFSFALRQAIVRVPAEVSVWLSEGVLRISQGRLGSSCFLRSIWSAERT